MVIFLKELFKYYNYDPKHITNRSQLYTSSIQVPTVHHANIIIDFPGYKSIRGSTYDYCVRLNGIAVSHEDILNEIYHHICMAPENSRLMETLLHDVSQNWENVNLDLYQQLQFVDYTLEEFVESVCYISVQEEINYPREKRYDGYKRPFYSYLEAIYAANGSNLVTYDYAAARCRAKNWRFVPLPGIPYSII